MRVAIIVLAAAIVLLALALTFWGLGLVAPPKNETIAIGGIELALSSKPDNSSSLLPGGSYLGTWKKGCRVTAEARPLIRMPGAFESFSRAYFSSIAEEGAQVLSKQVSESESRLVSSFGNYTILFCDNSAYIIRATNECVTSVFSRCLGSD